MRHRGLELNKTEHNAVGRFPEPGDEELLAGPSRNFQVSIPWTSWRKSPSTYRIPAKTSSGTTGGTRTRPGGNGASGNYRRPPERQFPPARPRLGRPAKGGRR